MNKAHGRVLILVCSGILACQGYVAYRVHQHYETFNGLRTVAPRLFRGGYTTGYTTHELQIPDPPPPLPEQRDEPPAPISKAPKSLPDNLEDGYYILEELNSDDTWHWHDNEWIKMPNIPEA